jgi:hypothetical protein
MSNDNFVKVFDVLDSGFRTWTFPAFGLIFVAIGLVIVLFPKIINALGIPNRNFIPKLNAVYRYSVLGFAILWTVAVFYGTYSQYLRHKALVQQNGCRVVEGSVEHFVPMPYNGHALESFSVAGVSFKYSDFNITDAFNNTSSHGGPIKADSYVRICYDPTENAILRLEIRDFKGEVKDYSRMPSVLSRPPDPSKTFNQNAVRALPWHNNLFIALYVLDFAGINLVFVPYLRTFFRLESKALPDCRMSKPMAAGTKTKLRNSMIYWDVKTRAIWLRPRGYNLIKVPLMVGRLNMDAGSQSIVGTEIRLSSGFPFVMALLLWAAYSMFTTVLPTNSKGVSPSLLVGVLALMFLVGGAVQLWISSSRMEALIDEAISELGEA